MFRLVALVLLLVSASFCKGQHSDEYINERIDSAWNYLSSGLQIPKAMKIYEELREIDREQGSYLALVNAYQIKGESYYYSPHLDSALIWYKKAYKLAQDEGDEDEMAYTTLSIGSLYNQMGKYEEALERFNSSLEYRIAQGDTNDITFILMKKGWLFNSSDKHEKAIETYMECLRYAEAAGDSNAIADVYNGIAVINKKRQDYDEAMKNFKRASDMYRSIGSKLGAGSSETNRAMVLKSTGRFQEAYDILKDVRVMFEKENFNYGVLSTTANMAICSNRLGKHERAIEEARAGIEYSRQLSRLETEADLSNEIGIAYLNLGDLEQALSWSTKSLELANRDIFLEKQRDAEKTLSDIYSKLGEHRKALEHYKNSVAVNDSIFQRDKSEQIMELQTRYETAEKEKEIQKLEAAAKMEELKTKSMAGGLVGVLLLSLVIINREVKRRKKARELHQSQLKLAETKQARLEDQLAFKNRELTAQALHIAQKNEMLQSLKTDLKKLEKSANGQSDTVRNLFNKIDFDRQMDKNWEQFIKAFTENNESFFSELTSSYPNLSKSELRLCALLKMNLGTKDIANILNISDDGVKKARYRLRKKMELETNESLESTVMKIG